MEGIELSKMNETEPHEPDPKRTKVRLQLKNGHDCIFREELPKYLQVECSICLCVLDNPHIIDCKCGAIFCQPCIQPTLKDRRPCPLCNCSFSLSIPNPSVQRAINSLQVYRSFKEAGCEWVGELGAVAEHLNDYIESGTYRSSGCPFLQLNCGYCSNNFQRQYVVEHETNDCLKRPYKCDTCNEFESTFKDVTTEHTNVCPCGLVLCPNDCGVSLKRKCVDDHLATKCPLEIISCSFSYAGCEVKLPRKDMPGHITDSLAIHMSMQAVSHQKQLVKLQDQVDSLRRIICSHLRIMPVNILMNGFAAKNREKERWWSEPFYTHPRGYKMALMINCNGNHEATEMYLSAYIGILQGEFDHQLKWPFRDTVYIQLFNQENPEQCYSRFLTFSDASEDTSSRVTEGKRNAGWGFPCFISHTELKKYLKNDSLCFRISYIDLKF